MDTTQIPSTRKIPRQTEQRETAANLELELGKQVELQHFSEPRAQNNENAN